MPDQSARNPKAYFDGAKAYQIAADRLYLSMKRGEKPRLPIRDPIYFLYAHAVELALKACLLACGFEPPRTARNGHAIADLYDTCRQQKLLGADDPDLLLRNFVALLEQGNEENRYRYPDQHAVGRCIPDPEWTKEAVGHLMADIEPHVAAWVEANPTVPEPSRYRLALGKPIITRQAVPPAKRQ